MKGKLGAFINLSATASVEILALAGIDFVIIDTEHGSFDIEIADKLVLAAESRGIAPWIRVRQIERAAILKALDIGASALLLPYLKTAEEAKAIVSWGKYRPLGDRGYGFTRSGSFGHGITDAGSIEQFFTQMNEQTMLIPQCETAEALHNIDEIVNTPGIDGIFIGPYDLSISLGVAADFTNPIMQNAYRTVLAACRKADKPCYILATTPEDAREKLMMGFSGAVSSDVGFLTAGVTDYVQRIKTLLSKRHI